MDLLLKDKVAIVTGGARGIGLGITEALAAEGMKVGVIYHSKQEESEERCAELAEKYGTNVLPLMCDVTDVAQIDAAFDRVISELGPVYGLVNNARVRGPRKLYEDFTPDEWVESIDGLISHMFYTCHRLVKDCLADGREGAIVNVSSKAAFQQNSDLKTPYVTGKGAVLSFTRDISKNLLPKGIRSNAILPGYVSSDLVYVVGTDAHEHYKQFLPTGEFAKPTDMGHVCAFLLSPLAKQMSGVVVDCTGGMLV